MFTLKKLKTINNLTGILLMLLIFIFLFWGTALAADSDGDGVDDAVDNCDTVQNADQLDGDFIITCDSPEVNCFPFPSPDGIGDACDNCPAVPNADQLDTDAVTNCNQNVCSTYLSPDGVGDACDNCPAVPNADQLDDDFIIRFDMGEIPWIVPSPDGVGDACDNCPDVPNDQNGSDSDGDGAGDACDQCPNDQNKIIPGVCGCDVPDTNSDGDAFVDCLDNCPNDPNKIDPGVCGCGIPDTDWEFDGFPDCIDNCVHAKNDQSDFDTDGVGDTCDNCFDVPNDQNNSDNDGKGDACDQCPYSYWKTEPGICGCDEIDYDRDSDGWADCIDNCDFDANNDQNDINNDGIGDACDCFDVLQGPYETGVDCGGDCLPCIQCTWCTGHTAPIRVLSNHRGKIDVVFVPEQSTYSNNLNDFENDILNIIRNFYLKLDEKCIDPILPPVPDWWKNKFNFYRWVGSEFTTTNDCSGKLPDTFWWFASFTDSAAILGPGTHGCASGSGPPSHFIAGGNWGNLVLHESGHSIFGLTDEYCGNTAYIMSIQQPNVWTSLAACQNRAAYEGWTLGNCRQIMWDDPSTPQIDCQVNFWRYDPDIQSPDTPDMMTACSGGCGRNFTFYEADVATINYVFSLWPSGATKGILLNLNINNDTITMLGSEVVDSHPDIGLQYESFSAEAFSSAGELLAHFGIWDPRIELGEEMVYTDNVDFTIIFPFYDNVKTFEIKNVETGEVLISVDLTETIRNHCTDNSYEGEECQSLDVDNDLIKDTDDNCPEIPNPEQLDRDGDGKGNVCDEMQVPVDIKPQSCPNPLNIKSKGVLPVAILGMSGYDITEINPQSIRLEGVAPIRHATEDIATPFVPFVGKGTAKDCTSAGPDGIMDLTLKFNTTDIVSALGAVTNKEVRVLHLTGKLYDGTPIIGEDVVILKK